ncbi:hypothetical protein ES703_68206 [subsurface metagenome]
MARKTTERAFADLPRLVGNINRTKSDIQEVIRKIEEIEKLAKEILDDPKRLAELKKILDIHPVYTATEIKAEIAKLKMLKEKLI